MRLPASGQWLVRVIGRQKQFILGEYRRHLKTIGYLGALDRSHRAQVTTRNWTTIAAIGRILESKNLAFQHRAAGLAKRDFLGHAASWHRRPTGWRRRRGCGPRAWRDTGARRPP